MTDARDPRIHPYPGDLVTVGLETRLVDTVENGRVHYGWPGKAATRSVALYVWRHWASQGDPKDRPPS